MNSHWLKPSAWTLSCALMMTVVPMRSAHAQDNGATDIQIVFEFRGADVALRVSDNGCGFVVDFDAETAIGEEHLGLLGMQERAGRIGGRLSITSTPGSGTVVEVTASADGR